MILYITQSNPVNTDTEEIRKGVSVRVRVNRARGMNIKNTCFMNAKTNTYNLKVTERRLLPQF